MLVGIAIAMVIVRSRRTRSPSCFRSRSHSGSHSRFFRSGRRGRTIDISAASSNSGYVFWVPEVYGSFGKTFNPRFLFGATMPGNPYGNVLSYVLTLTGLDGMLGDPGDPRYLMYPFAAAVFAIVGIVSRAEVAIADSPARDVVRPGVSRGAGRALPLLLLHRDRVHPPRDVHSVCRRRLRHRRRQPRDARGIRASAQNSRATMPSSRA